MAQCEVNPIELSWVKVRDYCHEHNKLFTLKVVEELIPLGFSTAVDSTDVEALW